MQEYETIGPLYEFLAVLKNNEKKWSDRSSWTMAKFMHQKMMKATKVVVGVAQYVVISCDDVSTVDNQSWLFIHCYVVQNW